MEDAPYTQEGLDAQRKAVQLAREMLTQEGVDLILGCWKMWGLLSHLTDHRLEPFNIFVAVASETDHLPLEVAPELLDDGHRAKSLEEAKRAADLYEGQIHEGCKAVLARYGDA